MPRAVVLAALLVVAACAAPHGSVPGAPPAERFDLIIRNGTVYDGSGAAGRREDVGIRGGDRAHPRARRG